MITKRINAILRSTFNHDHIQISTKRCFAILVYGNKDNQNRLSVSVGDKTLFQDHAIAELERLANQINNDRHLLPPHLQFIPVVLGYFLPGFPAKFIPVTCLEVVPVTNTH